MDFPSIWQTVPEDDLRCGSGPLCFDELQKICCSVDMESQLCGEFDFVTTPAKNVAGAIGRTSNVHTRFHNCIQTAYVSNGWPFRRNTNIRTNPFNFADMHTWNSKGSVTTNWQISFHGPRSDGALVIDISYSTYRDNFGGAAVGDQNRDGKSNTITDAAIATSKALLNTILEIYNLNNTNTNIGLILLTTTHPR